MRARLLATCLFPLLLLVARGQLKVASLHPLLSDLAGRVGGKEVEVISLLDENDDPHHFRPDAKVLRQAGGADLFLASGKGFENYLGKIKETLGGKVTVLELGDHVSSLQVNEAGEYTSCDKHDHGTIDPHWWHSISRMRQATLVLAKKFGEMDPPNAASYKRNAMNYTRELETLDRWARLELAKVPESRRRLATAHAAFGYFGDEFGFELISLAGVNREEESSTGRIKKLGKELRGKGVGAVFPEQKSNPKILQMLAETAGIPLGAPLNADGMSHDYEKFIRGNVEAIVNALGAEGS